MCPGSATAERDCDWHSERRQQGPAQQAIVLHHLPDQLCNKTGEQLSRLSFTLCSWCLMLSKHHEHAFGEFWSEHDAQVDIDSDTVLK